jgi:DNA-binding NarL/FixJ family response regulator
MNDTPTPRVLLADGDADVRRALALLLQTVLGLRIVGEAADLTGLSVSGQAEADLLLIDWASIAPRAAQSISQLRSLNGALRVIVLSTRPEMRATALRAGADAFLSKVDPPEQVIATLRRVLSSGPSAG